MLKITQKDAVNRLTAQPVKYVAYMRRNDDETRSDNVKRLERGISDVIDSGNFQAYADNAPIRHGVRKSYGVQFSYKDETGPRASEMRVGGCNFYAVTIGGHDFIICDCGFSSFAYLLIR